MSFKIVEGYDYPDEIVGLFSEYTEMLAENDPEFRIYLDIQNYDDEIKDLKKKYGPPHGRLYLALYENKPVGCIALRKLDHKNCEMKRLYVKPQYRGRKIGHELVLKIIEDAKDMGYKYMLLDTLPFLETAIKMYRDLGFYNIPPYNDSPIDNTIFLKLDLDDIRSV